MNAHVHLATPEPAAAIEPTGLWARLKAGTKAVHDGLDHRIGEGAPFSDLTRYGTFVLVQHDFHTLVSPYYQHAELGTLLPELDERDRLIAIENDLADLGLAVPVPATPGSENFDAPTALGWLYVAEGSNLGAAFLLKRARDLGLSETHGARHLAAAPEGRGLHWKTFTAALDSIALSADEQDRVIAGANAAFSAVRGFVEQRFFGSNTQAGSDVAVGH